MRKGRFLIAQFDTSRKTHHAAGLFQQVNGKQVKVSNLDKVFYPSTGFTKADVIDYCMASKSIPKESKGFSSVRLIGRIGLILP